MFGMKLTIFAIYFVCIQARSEPNRQTDVPKLFRNVRNGFMVSEGDRCVQNCTETSYEMDEMLSIRQKVTDNFNSTTLIDILMQADIASKLCRVINKTDICYDECPLSIYYQSALRPMVKSAEYACNQPKFMNSIPCYSRVFKETYQTCNAIDKCAAKKEMFNLNRRQYDYESNIYTFCDYASCLKDCRQQKIVEQCGQEESKILNAVFRKIFNAWDTVIRARTVRDTLPPTCVPFRQDNGE